MLVYPKLPPAFCQVSLTVCWYPFILLDGERHYERKVSCPRTQHNDPSQGSKPDLNPESSTLTTRQLHLHRALPNSWINLTSASKYVHVCANSSCRVEVSPLGWFTLKSKCNNNNYYYYYYYNCSGDYRNVCTLIGRGLYHTCILL